jgi:hypothetical protein
MGEPAATTASKIASAIRLFPPIPRFLLRFLFASGQD